MTKLSEKMRLRADTDGLSAKHPIRVWAKNFDETTTEYAAGTVDVKKFVGVWAKTRRIWCEYSGEDLV